MGKIKASPIQRVISRQGEGVRLTAARVERNADGDVVMHVDLSSAPVPDKRYVADLAAVFRNLGGFRLVFAQAKLGGDTDVVPELRSVVDVQMSVKAVGEFLASIEPIKENLGKLAGEPFPLMKHFIEPTHVAGLTANLAPIAFHGEECCIDFYMLSPFVRSTLKKGGDPYVEPVVRVSLPTGLLVALIDGLSGLAQSAPDASKRR